MENKEIAKQVLILMQDLAKLEEQKREVKLKIKKLMALAS